MSLVPRYDRAALADFYRRHTQAETVAAFGCSTGTVVRVAHEFGVVKARRAQSTYKRRMAPLIDETGMTLRQIECRLLKALSEEITVARNLLDMEGGE